MINALLQYGFLQNAVMASLLASLACGYYGTNDYREKTPDDERRYCAYRFWRDWFGILFTN